VSLGSRCSVPPAVARRTSQPQFLDDRVVALFEVAFVVDALLSSSSGGDVRPMR